MAGHAAALRCQSIDELARWWADRRLVPLCVPEVEGAHRALDLAFMQQKKLRPARRLWHALVRKWCEATGTPDPLTGGRSYRTGFWIDWLAARDVLIGDTVPHAVLKGWETDLRVAGFPWVMGVALPNQQVWRRHPNRTGDTQRHALLLTLSPAGALVDVVITRPLSEERVRKLRAFKRAARAARSPDQVAADYRRDLKARRATRKRFPILDQREVARRKRVARVDSPGSYPGSYGSTEGN